MVPDGSRKVKRVRTGRHTMRVTIVLAQDPSRTLDVDDDSFQYDNNNPINGYFGDDAWGKVLGFLGDGFRRVPFHVIAGPVKLLNCHYSAELKGGHGGRFVCLKKERV
jgi:hypothetical protein